ncbi:ABC-three component system protein [Sphaerisporangium sp. NPDC051017]|uniref:ABC-three component system protein n=1 Tax=Sphaerisporangium sp. NPDC051017 TaxID=3154636 RepID=UPI00344339B4
MLYELKSNLPGFKTARFRDGLNIAIARRSPTPTAEDGGDRLGKTSFVRLLDFLLGSDVRLGHPLRRTEFAHAEFGLTLDLFGQPRTIGRSVENLAYAQVNGAGMRISKFRAYLGKGLFGLTEGGNEPSFRSLMAYYLRDVTAGGFVSPTETYRKQRAADAQPALAYLFALDVDLVAKVREVGETDKNLRELRRAAKDSIVGMTLGRANDLDAQIRTLQIQRDDLAREITEFHVADRYARHRAQVDELSRRIRDINDRLVLLEGGAKDIEKALSQDEESLPDRDYLRDVFEQVGIVLPDLVTRRFDEVEAFHHSIVANRRRYLEAEHARRLREISQEREDLGGLDRERAELMRLLEAGGAFETYSELQRQISVVDGRLSELMERRAIVDRWGNANRHVQLRSAELALQISSDLHDRRDHIADISRLYASFAYRLYGDRRPAALTIEAKRSGYKFVPTIGGGATKDVQGMALFCFDLCMAVTAKRAGHGPDFLVHDSHLFEHVDARQVAGALDLVADTCRKEGLQYITTIDSDRLADALRERPDLDYQLCAEMTEEREDGSLFGIRY